MDEVNGAIISSDGDAKTVLLEVVKCLQSCDAIKSTNPKFKENGKSKCKDLILWLYILCKHLVEIEATPVACCVNEEGSVALMEISKKSLDPSPVISNSITSQVESSLKRPFEVIASFAVTNSYSMEN